jgi:hypothetical protein
MSSQNWSEKVTNRDLVHVGTLAENVNRDDFSVISLFKNKILRNIGFIQILVLSARGLLMFLMPPNTVKPIFRDKNFRFIVHTLETNNFRYRIDTFICGMFRIFL